MKIVKLVAENIKRLHAVEIQPEGALITIGGKNGAGKSSVLDSIAYAMGGEKLVPSEPIRTGESEAKIVVTLDDLVVTRKFKRERITDTGSDQTQVWGETRSTLTVTNADGTARYNSPQAVLDKLLGRLTFDPLQFARDDPKKQHETLRKLVGIDVTPIEEKRRTAFAERASLKRSADVKAAQILAMPKHEDVPAEEIPLTEISNEMLRAEELRTQAEEAERAVLQTENELTRVGADIQRSEDIIKQLQKEIAENEMLLETRRAKAREKLAEKEAREEVARSARSVVPDTTVIRQRLSDIEVTNLRVRANMRHAAEEAALGELLAQVEARDADVRQAVEDKHAALAAARFPVEGLGLSDDGVTFNGLPFTQAGSAEQVRVSVAIGVALNPTLKVLLIRNGNLLDSESLRTVAAQANEADMQVWMEWVSETKDGVAVMLIDGEVA